MIARVWAALLAAAPVRLWALILAAPPLTIFAAWLVWLIRYHWPADRAEQQLAILGYALLAALGLIGIIVVSLAAVKVKGSGPAGVNFEVDGDGRDDNDAPP